MFSQMLISQVLVAIRIFSVTRKSQCFSVICKMLLTQPAISCSKLAIETLEQRCGLWAGKSKMKWVKQKQRKPYTWKKTFLNNLILKMQKLSHFARLIRKYCWFQGQIMLQDLVCIRLMFLCFEEMVAYQIAGYSNLEAIFH